MLCAKLLQKPFVFNMDSAAVVMFNSSQVLYGHVLEYTERTLRLQTFLLDDDPKRVVPGPKVSLRVWKVERVDRIYVLSEATYFSVSGWPEGFYYTRAVSLSTDDHRHIVTVLSILLKD